MSGITGFWNLDGRPADQAVLARMSATMRHRGRDGSDVRVAGSFGISHQHSWVTPEELGERQPLSDPAGLLFAMDGRLDNRTELLARLRLPPGSSDAALGLAAYRTWGDQFAEHLQGDFAVAVFDPATPRVLLARDAMGVRPICFFRNDRLFAFSSEIKALLAHPDIPSRPDSEGIADHLLVSARPLDRQDVTCFAGVRALVPAHVAETTPHRTHVRRYWDFDTGHEVRLRDPNEYRDALRERLTEAVRRRLRSAYPVAISVSGGVDSSSLLGLALTLLRSGDAGCPDVAGISFYDPDYPEADERDFLAAIERQYDIAIERFPIAGLPGPAQGALDQISATEAPLFDSVWGVTREVGRRAAAAGARVLIGGQWGDQVLISTAYLVDLFHQLSWRTIRRHQREYVGWLGAEESRVLRRRFLLDLARRHTPAAIVPPFKWIRRRVFGLERPRPWFSDGFLGPALRFANQPATIGDGFHSAHARSIYLEARSKYHVHCLDWHNKIDASLGLDAATPMLDRDLVAFLMAIPGEMQTLDGVPRGLLRESMRGILPEAIRLRRSKGDLTRRLNHWVAHDSRIIREALTAESLSVAWGYLDAERVAPALERLVTDLEGPDCRNSWDLMDVFGLEVWLRVFFSAPPPAGE